MSKSNKIIDISEVKNLVALNFKNRSPVGHKKKPELSLEVAKKDHVDLSLCLKDQFEYSQDCEGFKITTESEEIYFLIQEGSIHCQTSGYITTLDDFSDFIGAEIKDIYRVTKDNKKFELPINESLYDVFESIFINIETNKGTLQFAVYNGHSGDYGANVAFISSKLKIWEEI